MDIKRRAGIVIPSKKYMDQPFYNQVKAFLTRTSQSYQYSHVETSKYYLESENFLTIPRWFPLDKYVYFKIEDLRNPGKSIVINHSIKPRDEIQERAMKYMMENECGTMELMPGVGKTVISIKTIAERAVKTIVLVHLDNLVEQWIKRVVQFTDCKEDHVARLRSETMKDDLDKPIIVSTVQTFKSLLKRNRRDFLIELNKAGIGQFVADEVHTTIGANSFSECSIHIPSKYTFGLSATPYRSDGNGDIINYHLGPIYSDDDKAGTMDPKIIVILADYQIDTPYRYRYIHWDGFFQRARYLNLMKKSKPLMYACKRLLERFKNDRNILFVAERIKLIEELYKWLDHPDKSMFCGSAELSTIHAQIALATPGKCRDGIDAPEKDCLIMTSPIANIKQLIGRICRPKPRKKIPYVIDMVDYGCGDISRTFHNRYDYYKEKGWDVKFILCKDNLLYDIDQIEAFNKIRNGQ
jgi:hypothetical protein